jgi:hypothetical protein
MLDTKIESSPRFETTFLHSPAVRVEPEPTVRFPVKCPDCGNEKPTEFPVIVVVDALRSGTDICLVATCHDRIWDATDVELEQIRECLGAIWLSAQR